MQNKNQEKKVFCGLDLKTEKEKENFVKSVFSSVSNKYDLMNDVMSFGFHRIWKNKFIEVMKKKTFFKKQSLILDLASGSGDIPVRFLKKYVRPIAISQLEKKDQIDYESFAKFIISDINESMIAKAKEKTIDQNLFKFCDFAQEDMTNLTFENEKFDLVTNSFGIRNSSNIMKSLEEIFRVLKKNSHFICMEFSPKASTPMIQKIYNLYSENLIPFLGEKITHDRQAYQYLVDSIKTFPNKSEFKKMLEIAGFQNVQIISMNFGIVLIFIAQKI